LQRLWYTIGAVRQMSQYYNSPTMPILVCCKNMSIIVNVPMMLMICPSVGCDKIDFVERRD
jgi:hypothetical protein